MHFDLQSAASLHHVVVEIRDPLRLAECYESAMQMDLEFEQSGEFLM